MRRVEMRAKHGWEHVAFVESETEADTEYEIKRHDDGRTGCACHAYVFDKARPKGPCKHIRALLGLAAAVQHLKPGDVAQPVRVTVGVETFKVRRAISLGPLRSSALPGARS